MSTETKKEQVVQESIRLPKWAVVELDKITNYLEFTRADLIRHYIYEGIRRDKERLPAEVFEKEKPSE